VEGAGGDPKGLAAGEPLGGWVAEKGATYLLSASHLMGHGNGDDAAAGGHAHADSEHSGIPHDGEGHERVVAQQLATMIVQ
jgi:hypothetical protein